jgi:hypothetical protein
MLEFREAQCKHHRCHEWVLVRQSVPENSASHEKISVFNLQEGAAEAHAAFNDKIEAIVATPKFLAKSRRLDPESSCWDMHSGKPPPLLEGA